MMVDRTCGALGSSRVIRSEVLLIFRLVWWQPSRRTRYEVYDKQLIAYITRVPDWDDSTAGVDVKKTNYPSSSIIIMLFGSLRVRLAPGRIVVRILLAVRML